MDGESSGEQGQEAIRAGTRNRRGIWEKPRRRRMPAAADLAEMARAGVVGLASGFVGGLIVFFIGSSRGLNAPGLEIVAIAVGGIGVIVGVLVALGRAAFGTSVALVGVALFIAGAVVGYGNGLRIVPGDTTDGTLEAIVPEDLAQKSSPVSGQATCRWTDRAVTGVASRGNFTWSLTDQATMTADIPAGQATATVASRLDGSRRTLEAVVGDLQLGGARGRAAFPGGAVVRWDCPTLP